jgi:ubiquitin-protein ligase
MWELKAVIVDPHPQIDVYVNDSDISFFKIILEAPTDEDKCPYKNGTFLLTCDFPESYPQNPPEIRFVTFILHPNVSKQGKVCVAELGRLWSSDITLKQILSQIYGLLLEPDLDNPLEIQASLKYYDDDGTYAFAATNVVLEHASKTREQWKSELCDEEDDL